MEWYNLKDAAIATGKTDRTIRNYLSKWKKDNPNKFTHKNIYRYEATEKGIKKLYVSITFLQTYFTLSKTAPEATPETVSETTAENNGGIRLDINEFEEKLTKREQLLREHFQKEFERLEKAKDDLVDSKQQMIDSLNKDKQEWNKDKDTLNYNLNKLLEHNSQQQMTIDNLLRPNREPLPLDNEVAEEIYTEQDSKYIEPLEEIKQDDIADILEQQQKPTGLRTNAEYFSDKENENLKGNEDNPQDFSDWLKSLNG